jgi:rSAM/selenodomain-associated transferase 2
MLISVIIPTLNEDRYIKETIARLKNDPSYPLVQEIIVVDGNSEDATVERAKEAGAIVLVCSKQSRAVQMNFGAKHATGKIFYFLHADTLPPPGYAQKIAVAVRDKNTAGCFRLRFDWNHWFLNINSWFTRINTRYFRFGDQSLFVPRSTFSEMEGFDEDLSLFEDQEMAVRLYRHYSFTVLSDYVVSSARKYHEIGPFRLQLVYFWIYLMYALGFSQRALKQVYQYMLG